MTDDMPKLPTSFGGFIVEAIVFFLKAAFFIAGIALIGGFGAFGLLCTYGGLTEHDGGLFLLMGIGSLAIAYAIGYLLTKAFKK